MATKRKVMRVGNSLVISIPAQSAEDDNIKEGDYMSVDNIGNG